MNEIRDRNGDVIALIESEDNDVIALIESEDNDKPAATLDHVVRID